MEASLVGRYPKPSKLEADRITVMMDLGCCACAFLNLWCSADHCHHIVQGNKRMGHWWTLPLCAGHHVGRWRIEQQDLIPPTQLVSISSGRHAWNKAYPTERELWERVQDRLHLVKNWPESKVLPRIA